MIKGKLVALLGGICLAVVLVAPLFTVACAKPAPAGPIKIGMLMPLSGPHAIWGERFTEVTEFTLDEINHEVAGRPIEAIIEDEGGEDISVALEKTKKLIEADKVDIIMGPFYVGSRIAVYPYTSSIPVPVVSGLSAAVAEAENEYVIWMQPSYIDSQRPLGEYAYDKLGIRTVTTIGADYSYAYDYIQGFTDAFQERGGKVVQQQWAPLTETDYTPYLASLKEADALVSSCSYPTAQLAFFSQFKELGLHEKMRIFQAEQSAIPESVMEEIGDSIIGTTSCLTYHYSADNALSRRWVAAFEAKYGRKPDAMDMMWYEAMIVTFIALEAMEGDTEPTKLMEALLKRVLDTPTAHIRFRADGMPVKRGYITEVQKVNGKLTWVILDRPEMAPKVYRGSGYKKFEDRESAS